MKVYIARNSDGDLNMFFSMPEKIIEKDGYIWFCATSLGPSLICGHIERYFFSIEDDAFPYWDINEEECKEYEVK